MKPAKKKPAKKASKSKSGGAAPPKKKSSSKTGTRTPTATKPVRVKTKLSVNGTLKNIKTENLRLTRQLEQKNRELEIEAALERVRARTMAMHKSTEILEVAHTMYEQLQLLGFRYGASTIIIMDAKTNDMEWWIAGFEEGKFPACYPVKYFDHPVNSQMLEDWKSDKAFTVIPVAGALKKSYDEKLFTSGFKALPERVKAWMLQRYDVVFSMAFMKHGALHWGPDPLSDEQALVLQRFTKTFEQTYTRFLDLQRAEAQAREAQIEAALERVRSRTIAMQHSSELAETSFLLAKQVREVGIKAFGCAFNIFDEDQKGSTEWFSNEEGYQPTYKIPREGIFLRYYEGAQRGESLHVEEFAGEACAAHYRYLSTLPVLGDIIRKYAESSAVPTFQIDHVAYFKYGYLLFVTYEPVPEAHDIFKRFAKVFEQTYTRFLDLQKAEAQTRESQIQLALERVRARTMAMQKSDELADVASLLFQQVSELGIKTWTTGFNVWLNNDTAYQDWITSPLGGFIEPYVIDATQFPVFMEVREAKRRGDEFFVQYLEGALLKETYKQLSGFAPRQFEKILEGGFQFPAHQYDHFVFGKTVSLMFITFEPVLETHDIFKRFGREFEQTYSRFLDLQKAEAQARESQIQLALERVRARTMAMQKSDELREVVAVVFNQMQSIGFNLTLCNILLFDTATLEADYWLSISEQELLPESYHVPYFDHPFYQYQLNTWKIAKPFEEFELSGELKTSWDNIIMTQTDVKNIADPIKDMMRGMDKLIVSSASINNGLLQIIGSEPLSEENISVLQRFANVFEQTYTRFLDLQKAEAQAREAQIEAALESVRASSMAMQKSNELRDVVKVVFEKLQGLGFELDDSAVTILIFNEESKNHTQWAADPNHTYATSFEVPYTDHPMSSDLTHAWENGIDFFSKIYPFEEKNNYFGYLFENTNYKFLPDDVKELVLGSEQYGISVAFAKNSAILIPTNSGRLVAEDQEKILKRFVKVFEQAHARFLDLQKAEAQSREAQIEASLERVRGKAMAMHSSEDLAATIGIFYRELESFSITPRRCGVGLLDRETRIAELSTMNTTAGGESIEIIGTLKMEGHPVLEAVFDNWIIQKEYHPILRGNEIKEYYQLLRPQISFPEYPNDAVQYGYFFFFPEGGVYAWTEKDLTEDELKIYRRFTSVLSLTYKRYKDLKDAEVRTKEAVKQATLDRVRAEIASMRTKQDLDRITPLIWNELSILGIPFVRCGVFIMDDAHQQVHTFLSTPDGKALAAFHLDYTVSNLQKMISSWHHRQVYITHWGEKEFGELADTLVKQGSIASRDQYLSTLPPEGIHLHLLPFMQGMLYVGNTIRLQQGDIDLLQSLADAFSTAYARYEDFKKLEAAKQQVDQALVELRQTQQQLVQAEKMASLGELTAGIAHEIQNPLNFVNNFSEVSNELIDEMVEEVKKGNFDDAKAIANDLKQNLEKINHHGKRADGIVKSMLQHSRTSSGQKEPTDINALCDEYLRLSYHGLRAKDKTFNAKFETDFDTTLDKINVIPQDIGRVILNLINNAFYAVTEKRKTNLDGYEPKVLISTKKMGDKVEIKVRDNGSGIPKKVLDKIFQPFFTTKPTGQGTGLGLSLSHDIVKSHGGELKLKTQREAGEKEEGAEFIIQLPKS